MLENNLMLPVSNRERSWLVLALPARYFLVAKFHAPDVRFSAQKQLRPDLWRDIDAECPHRGNGVV
jgi:hypothetical protein